MADRSKLEAYIAELEAAAEQRGAERERARLQPLFDQLAEIAAQLAGDSPADNPKGSGSFGMTYLRRRSGSDYDADGVASLPREGSDQASVLADIHAHPGSRGVDIVNRLKDVEERTIRTALHRLKTKGLIVNIDGVWFHKDADFLSNRSSEGEEKEGQPTFLG
jgi:hypothetical protein